jgi:hypothetical protein
VSEALKPCPFCGGPQIHAHEGSTYRWGYLACADCGGTKGDCRKADIRLPADHETNIAAFAVDWNRRAPDAAPAGEPATVKLADWRANKLEAVFGARGEAAERAMFEAFITRPPFEREVQRYPMDEEQYAWPGQYRDIDVEMAWEAWQARAALRADERAISASGENPHKK